MCEGVHIYIEKFVKYLAVKSFWNWTTGGGVDTRVKQPLATRASEKKTFTHWSFPSHLLEGRTKIVGTKLLSNIFFTQERNIEGER